MIDVIKDQISIFDLDIWSGKMSKEHYQAQGKKTVKTTEVKTSGQYLQKSSESQNQTRPMCLCLKKESGQKPGAYTMSWGGWSIAWRVHDTQFWGAAQYADGRMLTAGTPQRRERIALVADFAGLSAPEVLFERSGLRRDPSPQQEKKQETAGGTGKSTNKAISFQERAGKPGGARES